MNQSQANVCMSIQEKISVLWIVVMFNMVFADICSFMMPGVLKDIISGNTPLEITQGIMLVFAVFLAIPIGMIYLSRVLDNGVNRMMNIIASFVTILFAIGGGSLTLHYIFFASVEVFIMLYIIWSMWNWRKE